MKILYVITKSNFGGAQRYVYELAVAMREAGHRVAVASAADGILVDKLKAAGVTHYPIKSFQRDINPRKELGVISELNACLKDFRPDVIHLNSSKAGLIGAIVSRFQRVPKIIYTSHGWAFNEDRNLIEKSIFGLLHWLTVLFSHRTIVVSNALQAQLHGPFIKKKMEVIHLGREYPNHFNKGEAREALAKYNEELSDHLSDSWTGTIAELHPVKQHEITIRAIARLANRGIIVRHIIIGDGQEKNKLEELINELSLQKNVFLLGSIDEASAYLKAFDVFVLSSRSEAFGYVILEAAQAGLPIVASNVGGIPEIVQDGSSATLIKNQSGLNFAEGINGYLSDPLKATEHANMANRRAKEFSFANMVTGTETLYLEKS